MQAAAAHWRSGWAWRRRPTLCRALCCLIAAALLTTTLTLPLLYHPAVAAAWGSPAAASAVPAPAAGSAQLSPSSQDSPPFTLLSQWELGPASAAARRTSLSLRPSDAWADGESGLRAAAAAVSSARLLSLHWVDLNYDDCPDLFVSFAEEAAGAAAEAQFAALLSLSGSGCGQYGVVPGSAMGLPPGLSAEARLLFLDVDNDFIVDLCAHSCARSPLSARSFQCRLQCALKRGRGPYFTPLQTIERGGADGQAEAAAAQHQPQPCSVALFAADLNGDGVTELLHSSCLPDAASSSAAPVALRSLSMLHAAANPQLRLPAAQPRSFRSNQSFLSCLPQADSGAADCSAGITVSREAAVQGELRLRPGSACSVSLWEELSGDERPELICLGPVFPTDVQVFAFAVSSRATAVSESQQLQPELTAGAAVRSVRAACMGDYNQDGLLDYALATTDSGLALALSERSHGTGALRYSLTLPSSSQRGPALAVACFDADNDGDLDVLAAHAVSLGSGSQQPEVELLLYYASERAAHWTLRSLSTLALPLHSRADSVDLLALAVADVDFDGWLDVTVGLRSGALLLFRNTRLHPAAAGENRWLHVALWGHPTVRINTLGYGALVNVTLDAGRQRVLTSVRQSGRTAMTAALTSADHSRLHFGLGLHGIVREVYVDWPGSNRQSTLYSDVAADQQLKIAFTMPSILAPQFEGYHFRDDGCLLNETRRRLQPSFFILGQMKCGTTSLDATLRQHPDVLRASVKELTFFPSRRLSLDWYAAQFQCGTARQITGDATPAYLFSSARRQLLSAFPAARLIVLVRDPVARAWSQYLMNDRHTVRQQRGASSVSAEHFHQLVLRDLSKFQRCLAARPADTAAQLDAAHHKCVQSGKGSSGLRAGLYVVAIMRWKAAMQATARLLVLAFEQLTQRPNETMATVYDFIGVERLTDRPLKKVNAARSGQVEMRPATRQLMQDFYRPFNQRLVQEIAFPNSYRPDWIDYASPAAA